MNPKEYSQLLYETLQKKSEKQQGEILQRFESLLIKNKETYLASAIEKEFEKVQQQKERDNRTYIASASTLSKSQKADLENTFPAPHDFSVNRALLGGVAVRRGDKVYNATLRKQVELLRSSR